MRCFKYLIGIWTAIAVYSLFSLLSGPRGISAYNQLLSERDMQWSNIKELAFLNEELERAQKNLIYDQDTLLIHARQIGYAEEDEQFIRIVGLTSSKNTFMTTGKIYFTGNPDYISDKIIKIAALCFGLLVFTFFLSLEFIESKSR